jgi:hypothetical protein
VEAHEIPISNGNLREAGSLSNFRPLKVAVPKNVLPLKQVLTEEHGDLAPFLGRRKFEVLERGRLSIRGLRRKRDRKDQNNDEVDYFPTHEVLLESPTGTEGVLPRNVGEASVVEDVIELADAVGLVVSASRVDVYCSPCD